MQCYIYTNERIIGHIEGVLQMHADRLLYDANRPKEARLFTLQQKANSVEVVDNLLNALATLSNVFMEGDWEAKTALMNHMFEQRRLLPGFFKLLDLPLEPQLHFQFKRRLCMVSIALIRWTTAWGVRWK